MTARFVRTSLLSTALAGLLVSCGGHEPSAELPDPGTVRAAVAPAERAQLPGFLELQGTVESDRAAAVSARVMAMVTAVHVRNGEPVEKGQLLLEIDPQASRGQLSQARGALAQARAALALAERNYERFQALAETQAASELEVDMARMQYEQARGAVEQAGGAVEAASSVASDSRVTAPFSGRIVQRMVEVGDLAAPGRPLLMIQSEAARRLALTVPESLVLEAGASVEVSIDTRPELGWLTGIVEEMTPGADPLSHSYLVKVGLPVAELATGVAGRARVPIPPRSGVLVPEQAIVRRGGLELVVLKDQEGRASSRVVTTGRRLEDGRVEVLSGLSGSETVLLGLQSVPTTGAVVEDV